MFSSISEPFNLREAMLRLPDMFFSSTTLGIPKKKHEHIIWLVLNPHLVATLCSSFSRENGHPLLICSSLSTAQYINKKTACVSLETHHKPNQKPPPRCLFKNFTFCRPSGLTIFPSEVLLLEVCGAKYP